MFFLMFLHVRSMAALDKLIDNKLYISRSNNLVTAIRTIHAKFGLNFISVDLSEYDAPLNGIHMTPSLVEDVYLPP